MPLNPDNNIVKRVEAFMQRAHVARERLGLPHDAPITTQMIREAKAGKPKPLAAAKPAPKAQPSAPAPLIGRRRTTPSAQTPRKKEGE